MFHLKLLIAFVLLVNYRVKLTGTPLVLDPTGPLFEAMETSWICSVELLSACCMLDVIVTFSCQQYHITAWFCYNLTVI